MDDIINCNQILDCEQSLVELIENADALIDLDENEPGVYQVSPYYEHSGFMKILHDKNQFFNVLTLNCQSIRAKFEQIKYYVDSYNNDGQQICVLCLQETWLSRDDDVSLLQIPGYTLISHGKSCSAHGGVAVYIHESFSFTCLPLHGNPEIWDGQFIEIYLGNNFNGKKIVIGNIYRPPRPTVENLTTFTEDIKGILHEFRNEKDVLVVGDFNIDLLKFKDNFHINNFLEMFISSGYIPKITLPTRLGQRSGSLIDNIFVKMSDDYSFATSGILMSQISDHLPCFTILDYLKCNQKESSLIKVHVSTAQSYLNFKNDLRSRQIKIKLQNIIDNDSNVVTKV